MSAKFYQDLKEYSDLCVGVTGEPLHFNPLKDKIMVWTRVFSETSYIPQSVRAYVEDKTNLHCDEMSCSVILVDYLDHDDEITSYFLGDFIFKAGETKQRLDDLARKDLVKVRVH